MTGYCRHNGNGQKEQKARSKYHLHKKLASVSHRLYTAYDTLVGYWLYNCRRQFI